MSDGTPIDAARGIMKDNILGINTWEKHLSVLGLDTFGELGNVPYAGKVLWENQGSHLLFLDSGISMQALAEKAGTNLSFVHEKEAGLLQPVMTRNRMRPSWRLIRKDMITGTASKNFDEQHALIPKDEMIVEGRVLLAAILLYHRTCGTWLFDGQHVRCAETIESCCHLSIGNSSQHGLIFASAMNDLLKFGHTGIATQKKPLGM